MQKTDVKPFRLFSYTLDSSELSALLPHLEEKEFRFRSTRSVYDKIKNELAGIYVPNRGILAFKDSRLETEMDSYFTELTSESPSLSV